MKNFKQLVSLFVVIIISYSWSPHVLASDYLTEICFEFKHLEGSMAGQSGIVQLSLFDMGAGNYKLTSVVGNNLVQGTAILKGNKLYISTTDTGWFGNDGAYIVTNYCELDTQTLSGTFRGLDTEATLGSQASTAYVAGTIKAVSCP
ncbi:MAG: hypothetical protein H8D87_04745 [Deltaproteobacteria bacterium]|uniref:hypothetical protein n=1 Tax=Desulfobacula sp. TaxID=2593537 RepID=UPI0019C757A7|nr:hypothetical protein [Candidatus Desulfobacula maris]MBL6996091.1 hypothetical protein [Desulfobacula sp.]